MKRVTLISTDGQCCRINIGKYDLATTICQPPGNGEANATCTTRDNDSASFNLHRLLFLFFNRFCSTTRRYFETDCLLGNNTVGTKLLYIGFAHAEALQHLPGVLPVCWRTASGL